MQKKTGAFTGWIGYTLSWSIREFEELNFGNPFPFVYDRRHDASIVLQYELSDRINISGTWVYGTGNAVSLANSSYLALGPRSNGGLFITEVDHFTDRNNFRLPSYHRFDIGVNFVKQKNKHKRTWSFGAYNTYNRRNPFFIFRDQEVTFDDNGDREIRNVLKQQALFPVIPYFNYSFTF